MTPTLDASLIETLLAGRPANPEAPWPSGGTAGVDALHRRACADIERTCRVRSRITWDDYGSGHASYVDAWFYRPDDDFSVPRPAGQDPEYVGLVVLLCRLSPHFALGQGNQGWSALRSHRYMPSLATVDAFTNDAVKALTGQVTAVLSAHGLARAHAAELRTPLPRAQRVRTNLTMHGQTWFDVLFHWED
jgi:hypothetical protein